MALPAEVNSAETAFRIGNRGAGDCGPWTYEGKVFGLFVDQLNDTAEIWYDESPSRGESWTEADSANHPAVKNGSNQFPAACIVGDSIWIIYTDATDSLAAIPLSMSTLAYGTAITGGPLHFSVSGWNDPIAVVPLPGERLRVFHNGDFGPVNSQHQTEFVDLSIASGSWGTPTIVEDNPDTVNVDCIASGILLGISGLTHLFYLRSGSGDNDVQIITRSVSEDGVTISAEQELFDEPTNGHFQPFIGDRRYDVAGAVVKLAVPYFDNLTGSPARYPLRIFLADSETDPTWSDESIGADPVGTANTSTMAACWIGSQLHVAMTAVAVADLPHGAGDTDLYRVADTGSGWDTPAVVVDDASISLDNVKCRWIDNGLGIFYTRSAKPWYTEVAVDPCGGSIPVVSLIGRAY